MDTRDQALTKLTRLHDKSHPTHHRPASLRCNYSYTAVSIMELVMEKGWCGLEPNFARIFFTIKENFWSQEPPEGGTWVGTTHQGMPPSPGTPRWVFPTWWPRWWPPWYYKFTLFQKQIREKELSRSTRRSRRQALFFLGRADLESVWGSGEGDLHSSSSPILLHRQFHDAPHREWVIPS